MTTPFSTSERSESLMDWFQLHSREAMWGGLAVVALAAGGWFYNRSKDLKAERAEKAYYQAQRSVTAGNLPLAESDLKKMIERYDGTQASTLARLELAQLLYNQGKYQQGIDQLKGAEDKIGSSKDFGAAVHMVMAAGYEQLKNYNAAAEQYEKASKAARFDADRQRHLAAAAMDYLQAGNKEKARQIWTDLGADSKGAVAGEARVRLGELTATPAPKS
jgi:tetratricopeptide (TPR) repeat protein